MIWPLTVLTKLYASELLDMKNIVLQVNHKELFIFTNRLNQDPLENMFSIIRQKNGYIKNPFARMFRIYVSNTCSFSLMNASNACNRDLDDDEFLTIDISYL